MGFSPNSIAHFLNSALKKQETEIIVTLLVNAINEMYL